MARNSRSGSIRNLTTKLFEPVSTQRPRGLLRDRVLRRHCGLALFVFRLIFVALLVVTLAAPADEGPERAVPIVLGMSGALTG